jgi:ketosteroid isomerase-like protein
MTADPKAVVHAFTEAVAAHDVACLAVLLADDCTYEICGFELPGAGVYTKDAILEILPGLLELFEPGSPQLEIVRLIGEGPWVAAECTGGGRFRNSVEYENRYVVLYEVVEGRVRTLREYMDTQHAATLMALGTAT